MMVIGKEEKLKGIILILASEEWIVLGLLDKEFDHLVCI